jgi:hypothetical protein
VVYYVSNKQQGKINELTKQIKIMVENQQKFLNEQKEFQERRKVFSINMIRTSLIQLRHLVEEYDITKVSVKSIIPEAKSLLISYQKIIKQDLKNMTFQLTFSADILEPYHVEKIRHLLEITDQYIECKPLHSAQHQGIFDNIDQLLNELPNPTV